MVGDTSTVMERYDVVIPLLVIYENHGAFSFVVVVVARGTLDVVATDLTGVLVPVIPTAPLCLMPNRSGSSN